MRKFFLLSFLLPMIPLVGCNNASTPAPPPRSEVGGQFDSYYDKIEQSGGKVVVELDYSGTDFTDTDLAALEVVEHVKTLNLASTKITDKGLAYLVNARNLEVIDLSGTEITDTGLEQLKSLPNLRRVDYHHGNISRAALLDLMRFLNDRNAARSNDTLQNRKRPAQ